MVEGKVDKILKKRMKKLVQICILVFTSIARLTKIMFTFIAMEGCSFYFTIYAMWL
jgi:hypothetical protein